MREAALALGNGTAFWHGFTNMKQFQNHPLRFTDGSGVWVNDEHGKTYLNGFSSLINLTLGASQPTIVDAMAEQARRLPYFPIERASHDAAERYAQRLAGVLPAGLDTIFYASTGAEANETAFKIMRQYQRLRHGPDTTKVGIVSFDRGFHGVTYGALSATGTSFAHWRDQFAPLLPGFHHVRSPMGYRCELGCADACTAECADAVEQDLLRIGVDNIAGLLIEPVLGVGGILAPTAGYHQRIREICDRHDILLAYDEVVTGFGRLGSWFGADHFGVTPDLMSLAKGINSGYLPLAAVAMREAVYEPFRSNLDGFIATGSTNNGNPICCASGLATLDVLEREDIVARARANGKYMFEKFSQLYDNPIVGNIRGAGLLMAVELVSDRDRKTPIPKQTWELIEGRLALSGLILGSTGGDGIGGNIGIAPPLTIGTEEIDEMYCRIAEVLSRYERLAR